MRKLLLAMLLLVAPAAAFAATVDLNTATAEELDALPGIGPATAQAILDYRKEHGKFSSVDELDSVKGIGDATMAKLRPLVSVGGGAGAPAAPAEAKGADDEAAAAPASSGKGTKKGAATAAPSTEDDAPPKAAASAGSGASGSGCPVNINTADATWLQDLPGVGPGKATAILEDRTANGPYGSCSDLDRVKGFGAASLQKLGSCCVVK
jgi:competence protein ComEA